MLHSHYKNANTFELEEELAKTSRGMVFIKNAQHEAELGEDSKSLHKVYGARNGDCNPDVST